MQLRRGFVLIALLLAVLAPVELSTSAFASTAHPWRSRALSLINHSRSDQGAGPLRMVSMLAYRATRHSALMARSERLFHSSGLYAKVARWSPSCWGEAIAAGPKLVDIHHAWMHSAIHRAILLSRHYRHIGIGVVRVGGRFWVTAILYG